MESKDLGKVSLTCEGMYDSAREYEKLSLVTYLYSDGVIEAYVSRRTVPAGVYPTRGETDQFWQLVTKNAYGSGSGSGSGSGDSGESGESGSGSSSSGGGTGVSGIFVVDVRCPMKGSTIFINGEEMGKDEDIFRDLQDALAAAEAGGDEALDTWAAFRRRLAANREATAAEKATKTPGWYRKFFTAGESVTIEIRKENYETKIYSYPSISENIKLDVTLNPAYVFKVDTNRYSNRKEYAENGTCYASRAGFDVGIMNVLSKYGDDDVAWTIVNRESVPAWIRIPAPHSNYFDLQVAENTGTSPRSFRIELRQEDSGKMAYLTVQQSTENYYYDNVKFEVYSDGQLVAPGGMIGMLDYHGGSKTLSIVSTADKYSIEDGSLIETGTPMHWELDTTELPTLLTFVPPTSAEGNGSLTFTWEQAPLSETTGATTYGKFYLRAAQYYGRYELNYMYYISVVSYD